MLALSLVSARSLSCPCAYSFILFLTYCVVVPLRGLLRLYGGFRLGGPVSSLKEMPM
ncbi:hypothetical protein OE88DRAFT_1653046 [Heliocybe sulcata]|uniref:Uncharacterized protein n=1 Tax=Heliocybe sulcata TaxID=5364 RepID=A0A5C3NF40_9AGAM|nr:hypothetical protein OE88DRAFT_1653046 [Heliocybe sulcata]